MAYNFSVSNRVCERGILSRYLFLCLYMDDRSNKLNKINAGCIICSMLINDLMYADDSVLMAPSSLGLTMLLSS